MMNILPNNFSLRPPKWFYVLAAILLILLFYGCSSPKVVTKVEYKERVEYRDRIERDTSYVHDSVFVRHRHDTVFVDKLKYIYEEHIRIDTCFILYTDSIPYPVYVEKEMTKWQMFKLEIVDLALLLLFLIIGIVSIKIWKR